MEAQQAQDVSFRVIVSDALRYWETRRVLFNAQLLAAYLIAHFVLADMRFDLSGARRPMDLFYWFVGLTVLCVLANLCYTVVYPIDLFIQVSDYRARWLRLRWLLFAAGLVFGSCLSIVWASFFASAGVASAL